jgi:DNA polymerase-3 subunit gamma/tau
MSQAYYRKWRPHTWEEVIGQEHVIQTLRSAVAAERVAHAYLFAGPRGTGKTTTARLLAKAVNCLAPELASRPCDKCENCLAVNQGRFLDLIEIDAASNTSVEDVRSLRDKINFAPNLGRFKVYIVDEVHMLSTAAFNALLKTLEEPPPHAKFILATTEIHKIPATVLSRCQRHEFRRIPVSDIVAQLKEIVQGEGLQVEEDALVLVARQATGAMRDAISMLDQLASTGEKITVEMAQAVLGTAASQSVLELVQTIQEKQAAQGLNVIQKTLDSGTDPRQFARQVVDYLRGLLLVRSGNAALVDTTKEIRVQMARHAQGFEVGKLLAVIRAFNQAANESRSAWQPALPLEMAFMEAMQDEPGGQVQEDLTSHKSVAGKARSATPAVATPSKTFTSPSAATHQTDPQVAPQLPEALSTDDSQVLKAITENWRHILAELHNTSRNSEALLRSSRVLGVKNGAVYLGLSAVLKAKMERSENIDAVRRAFQQALNKDMTVVCVVYTGKTGALPPDVEADGMVAAALRDLGGEIVDIQ